MCIPLHNLLKKEGLVWSNYAFIASEMLEHGLISALLLAMPYFSLETNASGIGIGAMSMEQ